MQLTLRVNQKEIDIITASNGLVDVLQALGHDRGGFAVMLNGMLIPASLHAHTHVNEHDDIVIITAMAGG